MPSSSWASSFSRGEGLGAQHRAADRGADHGGVDARIIEGARGPDQAMLDIVEAALLSEQAEKLLLPR